MSAKYSLWIDSSKILARQGCHFVWKEIARHEHVILAHTRWLIHDAWLFDLLLAWWLMMASTKVAVGIIVCKLLRPRVVLGCCLSRSPIWKKPVEMVLFLKIPMQASSNLRMWRDSYRCGETPIA